MNGFALILALVFMAAWALVMAAVIIKLMVVA